MSKVRLCIDCGADISCRGPQAQRCIQCAREKHLLDKRKKSKCISHRDISDPFDLSDAYIALAVAILQQAIIDRKLAVERLKKNNRDVDAKILLDDVEIFVNGEVFIRIYSGFIDTDELGRIFGGIL